MLNTIKTTFGFLVSVVDKYTPFNFGGNSIEDIYNYLGISDSIATSGQPTEAQFHAIKGGGYKTVINLAPNSRLENSLKTERSLLDSLEIEYVHIPVDFTNPTDDDFNKFVTAMQAKTNEKVWVHCAANMRVSAFMYRYRASVLGEAEQVVKNDLATVWEPIGVWKKFISSGRES